MQTESFAGMFDQNAGQWARQEPMILSDFTARPLVLQELSPLTDQHVLDLGCGEGYVSRLIAQAGAQSVFGIDISSEMVGRAQQAAATGAPCPMTFQNGNAIIPRISAGAIRPGDRRVHGQLFELCRNDRRISDRAFAPGSGRPFHIHGAAPIFTLCPPTGETRLTSTQRVEITLPGWINPLKGTSGDGTACPFP